MDVLLVKEGKVAFVYADTTITKLLEKMPGLKGLDLREVKSSPDMILAGMDIDSDGWVKAVRPEYHPAPVKAECRRRIEDVANMAAQLNAQNYVISAMFDGHEQNDALFGYTQHHLQILSRWVLEMRNACADIIKMEDVKYKEDYQWPRSPQQTKEFFAKHF